MTLRCKEGDLALILYDEPGCESNIGRLVTGSGPARFNSQLKLRCWKILPVRAGWLWYVPFFGGPPRIEFTTRDSWIEIPDAWLWPILGLKTAAVEKACERSPA